MTPSTAFTPVTWRGAARRGAGFGVRLTCLYALCFAVYASLRAAFSIGAALEPGATVPSILGAIVSLIPPMVVIAAFMSLVSAFLGALTAIIIYRLLLLDRSRTPLRAAAVGLVTGGVIGLALVALASGAPGSRLTPAYPDTYLFWLALPTLVFVGASAWGGRRLNDLR